MIIFSQRVAAELTIEHLCRLFLIRSEKVLHSFLMRIPFAYPIYDLDYQQNVKLITDYLNMFSNLRIIGRGGTFHYQTSERSIEMGFTAAKSLLSERGKSVS
jgi:protoporphyrinogen oxidase